jgi:subtilisin family serine protease
MPKLFAFALFLVLLLPSQASFAAPRIYQVIEPNSRIEAVLGDAIVDRIPQLGILVARKKLAIQGLRDLGEVQVIRLDQPTQGVPKKLWGMKEIKADGAWAKSAFGDGIVIAVSDTGIDLDHPSLTSNIYVNKGEIAGNKIDDDKNGYIDDVNGWDFVAEAPASRDWHYHGTHVAGTIAAVLGEKIIGVAPKAKLMSVPFISGSGEGTEVAAAKTLIYAADNGAKIINCSWGDRGQSEIIEQAIAYAAKKGVLVIAAAGNFAEFTDRRHFFPAGANVDNIVAVAASDHGGGMAWFSNFGRVSVDLAAPGVDIMSSVPSKPTKAKYDYLNGTSMAAPHVSGVAALVWSVRPSLTYSEVRSILMETVTPVKRWRGLTVTGGVINAEAAVSRAVLE